MAALTRRRVPPRQEFRVCTTAGCSVGYHGEEGTVVPCTDLTVRPGYKDPSGRDSLVCYCFLHARGDIERELRASGATRIPSAVRAEIKARSCACEVRNPRGTCCLGDVERAVRDIADRIGGDLGPARPAAASQEGRQ